MSACQLGFLLSAAVGLYASASLALNAHAVSNLNSGWRAIFVPEEQLLRRAYADLRAGSPGALDQFHTRLRLNPASPYAWADAGEAYMEAREPAKARYCFSRAAQLGRLTPPVLLRAANFHFRMQENDAVYKLSRAVLSESAGYEGVVFWIFDRMGTPVSETFRQGVPSGTSAGRLYFEHLLRTASPERVREAWSALGAQRKPDVSLAVAYVDDLWRRNLRMAAAEVWQEYVAASEPEYRRTNYVYNGEFRELPTGSIFDWTIEERAHTEVSLAETGAAGKSLRITFDGGENLAYNNVRQVLALPPGRYLLRARIRTAGVTTDEGIRFRIYDIEKPQRLDVMTEGVAGDHDRKTLARNFAVPELTRFVGVQLFRRPSLKFDNKIAGIAWIDLISVSRVSA